MVSGRPPFRDPSALAVLKRVAEEPPRPIGEILPETPDWLCGIIAKLHAKNPDDRFQSARDVADLLADCEAKLRAKQQVKNVLPAAAKPAAWTASADRAVRPELSPLRAAATIALSWLPAILVAASLPRYVPVFDRWRRGLPALTLALMSVGRLGLGPIVWTGVGVAALLAGGGAGWVRTGLPGRRAVVFALATAGIAAAAVCMLYTLVPIVTAPVGR
jgi:hypothetical protein